MQNVQKKLKIGKFGRKITKNQAEKNSKAKVVNKSLGKKKMRTKFILKIQGNQLLGTMITNIRTKEFKKENNPNGDIHNFFGGKVVQETFTNSGNVM